MNKFINLMLKIVNQKCFVIAPLLILFGWQVSAASFEQALNVALETNSKIVAARQNYLAQVEGLGKISAVKLPTVSANISGSNVWDLKNSDVSDNLSVDLTTNYQIFDGKLSDYNIEAERLRIASVKTSLSQIEQQVLFEAITAYLNVLRDTRLVELSKRNVEFLNQQLDATTSRYELGELTFTEVAQSTAALESGNSRLVLREGLLALSSSSFETIVGVKSENLDVEIKLPVLPKSLESAKEIAEQFNLSLKASHYREQRARALWNASKSKSLPKLNLTSYLSGGQSSANNDFSNFGISLSGTLPIYNGGSLKSGEREAYLFVEATMAETVSQRLMIMQDVMSAWSDFEVSSSIISARVRQVEATELAHVGILEEVRLGSRTTLDALESEQALMNSRSDLETAISERLSAAYRILLKTGTLTPESLGLKSSVTK